jgi:hypothetical protein
VTWVAVAIGGSALVGAGASYLGSKKQADASKQAGALNMDMFNTLNRQQQPYIQSGYGAQGKLNTLLGINPNPGYRPPQQMAPPSTGGGNAYMPTPGGGVQPIMQMGPPQQGPNINIPERNQGSQLRQLLALRAAHGDRSAAQLLQQGVA